MMDSIAVWAMLPFCYRHGKGNTAHTAMLFFLGCLLSRMLVSKQSLLLLTAVHNAHVPYLHASLQC